MDLSHDHQGTGGREMRCIREDLIQKELGRDINEGFTYGYKKLSNKFIDWLFRHYYTVEMCENFYDSSPNSDNINWDNLEDRKKYKELEREYEQTRLEFCNWQDPWGDGIWNMTQENVDAFSRLYLKYLKKSSISLKGRLFFAQKDDEIRIYWYGRDFDYLDIWWIFKEKGKKNVRR